MISLLITIGTAMITAVVGPVIVEWTKIKLSSPKKSDLLGESIYLDEKIDRQLEVILSELECDRVCISQFHNGGHFYPTGKSIKKFSIFYERTTEYASSIKETFQNIPVSLFPKMFYVLYNNGEISIPSCKNNNVDCNIFQAQGKEYKTKSMYMLAIKDLNDSFVGTLAISFYQKEHTLSLEEWILLRQKVGVIGTILTDYLHGKK